jgi:predicted nucleotide-binding protein
MWRGSIHPKEIRRIRIFTTKDSVYKKMNILAGYKGRLPEENKWEYLLIHHTRDVTEYFITHPPIRLSENNLKLVCSPVKIFIVHGHNDASKHELARILEKLGLEPIILHEQPNGGKTLIEKIEDNTSDVGFAFILLTPDDKCESNRRTDSRARQNVILELGYFMGKLGRARTCCLYKKGVKLPSDIHGIVYLEFEHNLKEIFVDICKELKQAQYKIENIF